MHAWAQTKAWMVALTAAACLAAAPASTPAPESIPAPTPPATPAAAIPALQTKFENGDPINGLFTALALRFNVIIVQAKPVKAYILKGFELPDKLEDALDLARQSLEPQGYALLQSAGKDQIILRVVSAKEGKAAAVSDSPVSYGTEPEKIDVSKPDRLVTHILPITHAAIIETMRRSAMSDKDVSAEVMGSVETGLSLIIIGPAAKVQIAVDAVLKLDANQPVAQVVARTMVLKKLNAGETADRLNQSFARESSTLKATADVRTNSIVITGPEAQVLQVMLDLVGMELKSGPVAPRVPVEPLPEPPGAPVEDTPADKPGAWFVLPANRQGDCIWLSGGGTTTLARLKMRVTTQPLPHGRGSDGGTDGQMQSPPVNRGLFVSPLDGIARGSDNAALIVWQLAAVAQADLSPFVNKSAFS